MCIGHRVAAAAAAAVAAVAVFLLLLLRFEFEAPHLVQLRQPALDLAVIVVGKALRPASRPQEELVVWARRVWTVLLPKQLHGLAHPQHPAR
eukprot:253180-Chlamydomonas_euryale.AAC.1